MPDKLRVRELLEEMLDSDRSADEVCAGDPALLHDVRLAWEQYQFVADQIEAIFPTHNPAGSTDSASREAADQLPQVDGYDIDCVLGYGGMGVVYRARHLKLNRLVALKMLLAGIHAGQQDRARFTREAEAVAALRHPNIAQVYDAGEADGRPYFTMELVEGGSLAQKLAGTPQPAREAAQLVSILAGAVQSAHECGIVHRDLKPGNVLLAADGTPKITDFGLARRVEGEAGLTRTGDTVGTPSYMAPEQARGKAAEAGPAADIYALGSILYECLTGRPPFKGETGAETVLQVIHQDPVAPSRLNHRVPRDLETICLKCLHKQPARRYASAAALADDLGRFAEGQPIQARPVSLGERVWRWGRRNPTTAALLVTGFVLFGLAGGGGVWLAHDRAERRAEVIGHDAELRSEVTTAVTQAVSLRKRFHFREARELLDQAQQRLAPAGPEDLRRQLERAQADLNLAEHLDAARIKAATLAGGIDGLAADEPRYVSAFAEAGLGREGDDIEAVSARVRDSALSAELIAALDDWASITGDQGRREWLLAVAREADQNPGRNRLRQPELWNHPELWKDPEKLKQLNQDLKVAEFSPQLAIALGRAARASGGNALPFLATVQERDPQEFWLNLELAMTFSEMRWWDEALGYYRAALAVRPDISAAHNGVGLALFGKRRLEEAIGHFKQALLIDSRSVSARNNLAQVLYDQGRLDEAIDYFEQALLIAPKSAVVHTNLGRALYAKGRLDEAIDHLRQAVALNPKLAEAHNSFGTALSAKGRLDEAIDHWRQAVNLDPDSAAAHNNLGTALSEKGQPEEAIDHFRQAVRLDPKSVAAHINLGNALNDKGRLDEAIDHFQQALRLDPRSDMVHFNLGTALLTKDRLDEAIDHLRQAVRIDPKSDVAHNNLGIALCKKGQPEEAIDHFQQAVSINPKSAGAPINLGSAFYVAARDAVRAAAGKGPGKERLGEPERAAKRGQALAWLRADLELTTKLIKDGKVSAKSVAAWQTDPVLASVRDPAALAKLPDAEREPWQRFWADVAAAIADAVEHAARRDWTQAADCYARGLKRGPTDEGHFWFEYAALLLLSGDRPGWLGIL